MNLPHQVLYEQAPIKAVPNMNKAYQVKVSPSIIKAFLSSQLI